MKRRILLLLLCTLLLCGCGVQPRVQQEYAPDPENRLVIYTSHKQEVYLPIIREFEERTGIWVEVVTGGTYEVLDMIREESPAPKADVIFGGGVDSLEAYRDCFQPYACRDWEHIAAPFVDSSHHWTPFSALTVVLIYNTKLVDPDMLTCWSDLFRPEFQGHIAFPDPTKSGSGFTSLVTMLTIFGEEAFQSLAHCLGGKQLSSSGSVLTNVADGSALVGITLEETAMQHIAAGENIGMVYPADGTSSVPDGSAIVMNAPHPENAKAFLDFTMSPEVQQLLGSRFYRRSVRSELQPGTRLPALDTLTISEYDINLAAEHRDICLDYWAQAMKKEAE